MSAFLQTVDGDLDVSSHTLVILQAPAECLAQKLTNRTRIFLGDWYQDLRQGFPWIEQILGVKNPNLSAIATLFQRFFEGTPGVKALESADLQFVTTLRTLTANFEISTDTGAVLSGGLGSPFIVIQGGSGQA